MSTYRKLRSGLVVGRALVMVAAAGLARARGMGESRQKSGQGSSGGDSNNRGRKAAGFRPQPGKPSDRPMFQPARAGQTNTGKPSPGKPNPGKSSPGKPGRPVVRRTP